eukprot:1145133-Pelagomonas_calceolata.AAC.5
MGLNHARHIDHALCYVLGNAQVAEICKYWDQAMGLNHAVAEICKYLEQAMGLDHATHGSCSVLCAWQYAGGRDLQVLGAGHGLGPCYTWIMFCVTCWAMRAGGRDLQVLGAGH